MEAPVLSICIATFNRCKFIGKTLDSILSQLLFGVEVLVVDGASTDDTQQVLEKYLPLHNRLRYYKEPVNSGVDRDYDKAVSYAKGEYCWLMSDDDLLKEGAINRVLSAIAEKVDLVVLNTEIWNADFSEKLLDRRLPITTDVDYRSMGPEHFFVETANQLGFVGCVVIRRRVWLARDRSPFYGTMFIHVGVIFQHPALESTKVVAEPLISIRNGNATWSARTFEVWSIKWPDLIWSFTDFSEAAKRKVCLREQWRRFKFLLYHRAMGSYSLVEFNKFLSHRATGFSRFRAYIAAAFPARGANLVVVLYYLILKRTARLELFDVLCSRHTTSVARFLASAFGRSVKTLR